MQEINFSNLTSLKEYDNHEFVIAIRDKDSGLRAFIALHDSTLGQMHGGTRMSEYPNEVEAIRDALNLSKAMSYKSAMANLPYGGGKAVIMSNGIKNRNMALKSFAEKIDKLGGLFKTGTDVGLTDNDVQMMSKISSHFLGASNEAKTTLNTSKCAALGVFYATELACARKFNGESLQGKTVAIKGVGKLGGELARLLHGAGAKLIIADKDEAKLIDVVKSVPIAEIVDSDDIHRKKVDFYAPCAFGNEFDDNTINELNCKVIVGGANNQLSDEIIGDKIYEQGIMYVPDYIANAGGLIYVSEHLEKDGFKESRVMERLLSIKDTLDIIFNNSQKDNKSPNRVAEYVSKQRIKGSK